MRSTLAPFFVLAWVVPAALVACGGDDAITAPSIDGGADATSPPPDASPEASPEAAPPVTDDGGPDADGGAPDVTHYPAFYPPMPAVLNFTNGPVLAKPRIVPIVFAHDDPTVLASIEDFAARLGSTDYMQTVGLEYGVHGATSTPPVVVPYDAPATIADTEIIDWIARHINPGDAGAPAPDAGDAGDANDDAGDANDDAGDGGDAGHLGDDGVVLPENDGQSIYIVFYPAETTITSVDDPNLPPSKSCIDFGAYHNDLATPGRNGRSAYAVVARCNGYLDAGGIDFVTAAASREIFEAATDPFPSTNPAFYGVGVYSSGWSWATGGGEIGDLCKLDPASDFEPAGFAHAVQRMWSDNDAFSGHDPCIPHLDDGVYFSAMPLLDRIAYDPTNPKYLVEAIDLEPGKEKTIEVHLYSDGPMDGPFTVSAAERGGPQLLPDPNHLITFAWDRATGQNGDVLHLTVARATPPVGDTQAWFPFVIESTRGARTNRYWGIIGH